MKPMMVLCVRRAVPAARFYSWLTRVQQDLNGAFRNISLCKDRIQGLLENKHLIADEDVMRARSFIHILRLFQAEVCCLMKNWGSLLGVIQVRQGSSPHCGRNANLVPRMQ